MALSMLYGVGESSWKDEEMSEKEKLLGMTVDTLALKVDADQKIIGRWKVKDEINSHDIKFWKTKVSILEKKLEHKEIILDELQNEASDSIKNLPYICSCVGKYTTALGMRDRVIEGLSQDLRETESKRRILHDLLLRQPPNFSQENNIEIKTVLIKMLNDEVKHLKGEVRDLEGRIRNLENELNEEKKLRKDAETKVQQLQEIENDLKGHFVVRATTQARNRLMSEENEKLQAALSESLADFSVVSAQLEKEKMKNAVLMEKLKEKDAKLHETSKGVGRILRGAVEVGIGMKEEDVKSEDVKVDASEELDKVEDSNNNELYEVEPESWDWSKDDESTSEVQSVVTEELPRPKKDKKTRNQWSTVMKNGKTCLTPGFELFRNEAPNKDKKSGKKTGKKSKKAVKVMKNGSELMKSVDVEEVEIHGFYEEQNVADESDIENDTVAITGTWLSKLFWFIVMIFLGLIFKVFA